MKRLVQVAIVLLLLVAIGYTAFSTATQEQVEATHVELQTLRSERTTIDLQDTVILNFWATYCPPCEREMPAFNTAHEKLEAQNIALYAVNVQEPTKIVTEYVTKKNLQFPVLLDRQGELKNFYEVTTLPTTLFVKDGEVVHRINGEVTEQMILAATTQYFK